MVSFESLNADLSDRNEHDFHITQLGFNDAQQGWEIQSPSSIHPTFLQDPSNDLQEKLLRWYFEEYPIASPLEKIKVSSVEIELKSYGTKLLHQIYRSQLPTISSRISILVDDGDDASQERSINELHWEALEGDLETSGAGEVSVTRIVRMEAAKFKPHEFAPLGRDKQFRVLLIVARRDLSEESHHRIAASILSQCSKILGENILKIDIVRPGTFQAFRKHLARAKQQGIRYNLVHFDMHGSVSAKTVNDNTTTRSSLYFYPEEENGPTKGEISASRVAAIVARYHIPYVFLGACETGTMRAGREANLASVFVRNGVPFVMAMSYKLIASALEILVKSFYTALLLEKKTFIFAAASARKAMRVDKIRRGKFGLPLPLEDWLVPVTYVSQDARKLETLQFQSDSTQQIDSRLESDLTISNDWDIELLNLETRLLDPWDCGSGPVVNIYGFTGIGKTTLLRHCMEWWTDSEMVQKALYFGFTAGEYMHPLPIFTSIANILEHSSGTKLDYIATNPKISNSFTMDYCLDVISSWLEFQDKDRRLLLVIDDFPTYKSLTNISPLTDSEIHCWMSLLHDDFARFRGRVLVIIGSCSKLQWLTSAREDNGIDEVANTIEFDHQNQELTSLFYSMPGNSALTVTLRNQDTSFWMALQEPERFNLLSNSIEYFARLPVLMENFIAKPLQTMESSVEEQYKYLRRMYDLLLRGRGLPDQSQEDYLRTLPVAELCKNYFISLAPLEKAILLSLSPFSCYLGTDLGSYWCNYVRCLQTDVSRCLPRRYRHRSILSHFHSSSRRPSTHWIALLAKQKISDATCYQSGEKIIQDLCRLGLLKPASFFLTPNASNRLISEPAYQIHPCLLLYLRQIVWKEIPYPDNFDSHDTWTFHARMKACFLTYLRKRLESWDNTSEANASSSESLDAEGFKVWWNNMQEERLLSKSLIGGLHMWLEMNTDHSGFSFPNAFFKRYIRSWPELNAHDLEPSSISTLTEEIRAYYQRAFLRLKSMANTLYHDAISHPTQHRLLRWRRSEIDLQLFRALQDQHEKLRQSYSALRDDIFLGNWLVACNIILGKPKTAMRHLQDNEVSLAELSWVDTMLIPEMCPTLAQELQRSQMIARFLNSSSHPVLSKLDEAEQALEDNFQKLFDWLLEIDDPNARKFNAIGPRLLREGYAIGRASSTWGIRTKEETTPMKETSRILLRNAFEEIMSIPWDWYKQQWDLLCRGTFAIASQFGMESTSADLMSLFEESKQILPPDLGCHIRKISEVFGEIKIGIMSGRAARDIFDMYYDQILAVCAAGWRSAILFGLDFASQTKNIYSANSYHQFIIADYFWRKDWVALDQHLTSIGLDKETGGEAQWEFCRGLASLRLHHWEPAGIHLENALTATHHISEMQLATFGIFGLTGLFTVRCLMIQYLLAYKYAVLPELDTCSISTPLLFTQYWILGYATKRKMNYAQSGALLEHLTEHYFTDPEKARVPERVLDLPAKEEYGRSILNYEVEEGKSLQELHLSPRMKEAHILVEFINHAQHEGLLYIDDVENTLEFAQTFFDTFEESQIAKSQEPFSVKFFNKLKQSIRDSMSERENIFEEMERELSGCSFGNVLADVDTS